MTGTNAFAVVLFESVSHALLAEKLVKVANIPCKMIPVPRQLSSDCGVCLRFGTSDRERIEAVLTEKLDHFAIALL